MNKKMRFYKLHFRTHETWSKMQISTLGHSFRVPEAIPKAIVIISNKSPLG